MTREIFSPSLYKDKTVVVVGGSSGINLAIAQRFSTFGAKVAVISRDQKRITKAAGSIEQATGNPASGHVADVRDYGALEAAYDAIRDTHGDFDVLISGAAGNFVAPVVAMSANGFKTVIDIDLNGTFNAVRAASDYFNKTGATIINISAPQADNPYPGQAHVSAAKAGLNMLTKSLAMEWGVRGIRVNAISPGPIENTEGMRRLSADDGAANRLTATIPLKRYGRGQEIADLAVFLCSGAAAYITGAIIPCDGGFTLAGAGAWQEAG